MVNKATIVFLLVCMISCSDKHFEISTIENSQATIREGIAVDPQTGDIYISNLNTNTISRSDASGQFIEDALSGDNTEYGFGLGMDVHQNKLYALSNKDGGSRSQLFIIDHNSELTESYAAETTDSLLLNDVAINQEGDAYISDSKNNQIFKYDNGDKTMSLFFESDQLRYPNGIAINNDGTRLFISSSTHGIRVLDIETKKILNAIHETSDTGIDGMKFKNGYLYFVMRSRGVDRIISGFYRVKVNDEENDLGPIEKILIDEALMPDPTTISVTDRYVHILSNSQLDLYDEENNSITDLDLIENTKVLTISFSRIGDIISESKK